MRQSERGVLINANGSSDLIVTPGKRGIGAGPCFGICKALFDCLIALGTGTKLLVEDMGLEEKFQPLFGIEACTGRLHLKHGADRRHVNSNLVRGSQQVSTG